MKLTYEADYAIRIIFCLAQSNKKCEASVISKNTSVPLRFTLKILRKFVQNGIVKSFRGAAGGYILNKAPEQISILEVIETVSGPIKITHCLEDTTTCTRVDDKTQCQFHRYFDYLNNIIVENMGGLSFAKMLENTKTDGGT